MVKKWIVMILIIPIRSRLCFIYILFFFLRNQMLNLQYSQIQYHSSYAVSRWACSLVWAEVDAGTSAHALGVRPCDRAWCNRPFGVAWFGSPGTSGGSSCLCHCNKDENGKSQSNLLNE